MEQKDKFDKPYILIETDYGFSCWYDFGGNSSILKTVGGLLYSKKDIAKAIFSSRLACTCPESFMSGGEEQLYKFIQDDDCTIGWNHVLLRVKDYSIRAAEELLKKGRYGNYDNMQGFVLYQVDDPNLEKIISIKKRRKTSIVRYIACRILCRNNYNYIKPPEARGGLQTKEDCMKTLHSWIREYIDNDDLITHYVRDVQCPDKHDYGYNAVPVYLSEGITFDENAIEKWVQQHWP